MSTLKRGRPKKNPEEKRSFCYHLRLTKEEFEELKCIASELGCTKSKVIRIGIELIKEKSHARYENGDVEKQQVLH